MNPQVWLAVFVFLVWELTERKTRRVGRLGEENVVMGFKSGCRALAHSLHSLPLEESWAPGRQFWGVAIEGATEGKLLKTTLFVVVLQLSHLFASGGQSLGASASASVLPMNIQDWFPLGWTDFISCGPRDTQSINSKASIVQCSAFLMYGSTLASVRDYRKNQSLDYMDLCLQSEVSAFKQAVSFVIDFLPRSKCLLISWLQSLSTVILEPKKIKSVTVSTFSLSICHEVMRPDAMILVVWMLNFKARSFTLLFHPYQETL